MSSQKMINYKVGYEGELKRFAVNPESTNFKEFCEKCTKAFKINPDHTILVIFQEKDKQLIIRNEVDFALAVHANIFNNQQKSISFKISAVPAEPKLNESQAVDSRFKISVRRDPQSDVEISKEDLKSILEKGLNHADSEIILNKIADSIPVALEKINIKYSSSAYMSELLKEKIEHIRFLRQQFQLISNEMTDEGASVSNAFDLQTSLGNKTPFDNSYNNIRLCQSIDFNISPTPQTPSIVDIADEFNASIASSTHNLKISYDNIFQQFNQNIEQITQSVRNSLQNNKDLASQNNRYSNTINAGQNAQKNQEKCKKVSALDQLALLTGIIENSDNEVDTFGKQLIEEQDQDNVVLSNIQDKITEHTNLINKANKRQDAKQQQSIPSVQLFDGLIKHVEHGINQDLIAPFEEKKEKSEESAYQKIFNQN